MQRLFTGTLVAERHVHLGTQLQYIMYSKYNTLHARARAGPVVQSLVARDSRAVAEAEVGAAAEILTQEAAAGVIGVAEQGNSTHPGAQLLRCSSATISVSCHGRALARRCKGKCSGRIRQLQRLLSFADP